MRPSSVEEALGLQLGRPSGAARLALALALGALWLLGRRYSGVTHDAKLYLLSALRRLDPLAFGADPFFAHGSQDAYTLFPILYAPLVDALGQSAAAALLTVAGQLAFFAAAAMLVWRLAEGHARWWSMALVAMSSGYYGGGGVFRIAESFATARTLAEPLVVAAFAAALSARHALAWAMLAIALFIHPLVAASGAAVLVLMHAARRRHPRWIALALLLACGLAVAVAAGSAPFDEAWRQPVELRSPHLFLTRWALPDWSRLLWGGAVLWLALGFLPRGPRSLALAALVAAPAGIIASGISVDVLGSAFAAGLQLWRSHWPMHFLAMVLCPVAIAGLWRSGTAGRAAAVCLAASCCFGRSDLPAGALLAAIAVALHAAGRRWPSALAEPASRAAQLVAVCSAAAGLLFEVQSRMPLRYGATANPGWSDYVYAGTTIGGLVPLAALLWLAACSRWRRIGIAAAAIAFVGALLAWDARTPWRRFIEEGSEAVAPFRREIAPGAQVFWPSPESAVWLLLQRASWHGEDQGAGIVFSRDAALDYAVRKRAAEPLVAAANNCVFAGPGCRIPTDRAQALCARADGPQYLVLEAPLDALPQASLPVASGVRAGVEALYLYGCAAIAANEKGRR